jgi:hypothetical protein
MIELTLTEQLQAFIEKRRRIKVTKAVYVKKQDYESAARARNAEKELEQEAIEFLKKESGYALTDSKQVIADIWMVFDLVGPGETTFEEAIKRITPVNMERINIVKKVEEYKDGKISLDDLHEQIKKSFKAVRQDIKNTIINLE